MPKTARANKDTEEVAPNGNPNSSQNVDSNGDLSENVQPQSERQSETNGNHQKSKRRLSKNAIQQLENA